MCDVTRSFVCRDSLIRVPRLSYREMQPGAAPDVKEGDETRFDVCDMTHFDVRDMTHFDVRDMTRTYV